MALEESCHSLAHLTSLLSNVVSRRCQRGADGLHHIFSEKDINRNFFSDEQQTISAYMGEQLQTSTADEINRQLHKLMAWTAGPYKRAKDTLKQRSAAILYEILRLKVKEGAWLVVKAQQEAPSALGVFLVAANLHLILLQELCDTDCQRADNSEYHMKLVNFLSFYLDHATTLHHKLIEVRRAMISNVVLEYSVEMSNGQQTAVRLTAWWDDLLTGEMDMHWETLPCQASSDASNQNIAAMESMQGRKLAETVKSRREHYVATVMADLCEATNDPKHTIVLWAQGQDNLNKLQPVCDCVHQV